MKKLINLFRKRRTVLVRRDPLSLTIEEWRQHKDLVAAARRIVTDETFQGMVETLRNSHLVNYCMNHASLEDRAFMQARGEGYTQCINNLLAMACLQKSSEVLEPTFEPPE